MTTPELTPEQIAERASHDQRAISESKAMTPDIHKEARDWFERHGHMHVKNGRRVPNADIAKAISAAFRQRDELREAAKALVNVPKTGKDWRTENPFHTQAEKVLFDRAFRRLASLVGGEQT